MQVVTIDHVKNQIKDIIVNDLDVDIAKDAIRDDVSLYEDGIGLDSITLVNFIVLVEKKFNFNFDENDVNADLFSSINNLAQFIDSKIEAGN